MSTHHWQPGMPRDVGGDTERWLDADEARSRGLTEWGNPDTSGWTSDHALALLQAPVHRNVNWRYRNRAHCRSNTRHSLPNRPGYAAFAQQAGTDAPPGQECIRCRNNRCAFTSCAVLVYDGEIAYKGSCIACGYGDAANRCSNRDQLPQYAYDLLAAENPDHPILHLPANAAMAATAQQAQPAPLPLAATEPAVTETATTASETPTTQTVMEYEPMAPGTVAYLGHIANETQLFMRQSGFLSPSDTARESSLMSDRGSPTPSYAADETPINVYSATGWWGSP
ncbi:hypothetical protein N7528_006337 [Penicillium herquei]|nr:hypothetical protein N7528_006337 [Penicillium herquei]